MTIRYVAECDNPECDTVTDAAPGVTPDWPESFTVIDLIQVRGMRAATGQYGFCSPACLTAWSRS